MESGELIRDAELKIDGIKRKLSRPLNPGEEKEARIELKRINKHLSGFSKRLDSSRFGKRSLLGRFLMGVGIGMVVVGIGAMILSIVLLSSYSLRESFLTGELDNGIEYRVDEYYSEDIIVFERPYVSESYGYVQTGHTTVYTIYVDSILGWLFLLAMLGLIPLLAGVKIREKTEVDIGDK